MADMPRGYIHTTCVCVCGGAMAAGFAIVSYDVK